MIPAAALLLVAALLPAQGGGTPPQKTAHHHEVEKSGDMAMGFSHEKTTHHFYLRANGGVIQVDANAASDKESREQIQTHLAHIATMFAKGNFETPMLVHGVKPPGTVAMTKLNATIRYTYEARPQGGRVVIATSDKAALAAVHEFLRFQIQDHATGDPTTITAEAPAGK